MILGLSVPASSAASAATPDRCATAPQPKVDLSGCDLSGRDLSGVSLKGANLSNANLSDAQLMAADLRHANLSFANLTGARVTAAQLGRANFFGAQVTGLYSGQITTMPDGLYGWELLGGYLIGPGADLDGTTLTYRQGDIWRIHHAGLDLHSATFRGAYLLVQNFAYSNLQMADFSTAVLYGGEF